MTQSGQPVSKMWMTQSGQRLSNLRPCPWCGEKAWIKQDRYTISGYDDWARDLYEYFWVECSGRLIGEGKCHTRSLQSFKSLHVDGGKKVGHQNPKEVAIDAWNAGEIRMQHLHVHLPQNHYVLSRQLRPSPNPFINPANMDILVTTQRGIAQRLKADLSVVFGFNDIIHPYRFQLVENNLEHTDTKLTAIKIERHGMIFSFESADTRFDKFGENKTDTAWLKRKAVHPPINDRVFDILAKNDDDDI